jgi:prepilin-type N-terminal cleavage/methylation domain-containing protein
MDTHSILRPRPGRRGYLAPAGRRAGFTMIEVTLALLVVAVGVLGAFSLIPAGLQTNRKAIDETRAAMFAEMFFNSIRMQAQSPGVTWAQVAANPARPTPGYGTGLPAARRFWVAGSTTTLPIAMSPRPYYQRTAATPAPPDLALRYFVYVTETVAGKVKTIRLLIWPEYGPTSTGNAMEFYTEILNPNP